MPVPDTNVAAAAQAEKAVRGGDGNGALSEAEAVRRGLAAERLNRTVSLPDCLCIRPPRIVSYAEVGDPNGIVVSSAHAMLNMFFETNTVVSEESRRPRSPSVRIAPPPPPCWSDFQSPKNLRGNNSVNAKIVALVVPWFRAIRICTD